MALKVGNEWKEHGWWIKVDATQKPMLWIMSYMVVEGRYWSAVGKSFGEISTISPSGSDDVLVTVSAEETSPSKIRLQRRLLFAPIPRICTEKEDGYYYDVEGVRYRHSGEDGQYTYEQVASIFEGTTDDDRVPSPALDAMVSKAIDYVTADTPPRSPTPPELHLLYECRTPPHEG
jgi:hypothetical protein